MHRTSLARQRARARELERRQAYRRLSRGQRRAIRAALAPAPAQLRLPID